MSNLAIVFFLLYAIHFKMHAVLSTLKYVFFTAIENNYCIENVKGVANTLSSSDFKYLY